MINLPNNSPQPAGPSGASIGGSADSKLPVPAASSGADNLSVLHPRALICPTRVDLNAHWLQTVPSFAAIAEWHALLKWLDISPMKPALN